MNYLNLIILILVSILFSAFFSGMEIAFVSANKLRIEIDRKQKKILCRDCQLFYQASFQVYCHHAGGKQHCPGHLRNCLCHAAGRTHQESAGRRIQMPPFLLIQTLISTLIILLTAEFLPKTLFRINPNNSLRLLSVPIMVFYVLLYPITIAYHWLSPISP